MTTKNRPRAARTIKRHATGARVFFPGVSGTVIESGLTHGGEILIVRMDVGTGGMKYAVTIDGEIQQKYLNDPNGELSTYAKLEEACHYANF